jgi:serine/threonine protein kinase/tetratricopeptide (TPR) repeat protein
VEPPPKPPRSLDELSDRTEAGEPLPIDPRERDRIGGDSTTTLASRVRRRSDRKHARVVVRELARGELVGRYVILEKLGAGAMGIVHAAYDPDLDRKVALKLLHGERNGQRLLREAQAMARLSHPNVITVHDVGEVGEEPDARVFMAMEFVDGTTLGAWARARERSIAELLDVFQGAGRGLAAAHASGLVHRDFKPDNVMIGNDGRVRVMDFGLVRAQGDEGPREGDDATTSALTSSVDGSSGELSSSRDALMSSSLLESRLTVEGSLLGTPAYMAPEQLRGESADARSDQFAFCVALWECLSGERPFAGDNPLAVLFAISQGDVREPQRAMPGWLRRTLMRGLAARPEERWPDMRSLLAALADDPRVRARRWLLGLGSLAVTGVAAALLVALWPEPPELVPPCQAVDAPIRAVWSGEQAAALRETFAASQLAYAEASATRVIDELDRWSDAWALARRDACEATELRREQSTELLDLRMACLDQRLHGFVARLELFERADATIIEKSIEAIEGLPRIEPCSDRAWLVATARPPEDPALASEVVAIEADVARVLAWVKAGKAADARPLAEATLERAARSGWPAVVAEASLARGHLQQELGEFEPARSLLEDAYFGARRTNQDEVALQAAVLLVYGHAVGLGEFALGGQWQRLAAVEADRLGRPDAHEIAESSAGIYWYMQDDVENAAKAFAAQIEQSERAGSGPSARGQAHVNYGSVLVRVDSKRFGAEAIDHGEQGVALLEQAYGPDHPQLGLALGNLATIYGELERHDEAIARLERGLAILERSYGPDHPHTGLTELNLSTNLAMAGRDLPRAVELARDSLRVHEQIYGPEHTLTGESLRALARAHHGAGQHDEALEAIDRAIAIVGMSNSVMSSRDQRVVYLLELGRIHEAELELDALAQLAPAFANRIEHPRTSMLLVELLLEHPGQRERIELLLHLAAYGIRRADDVQLRAEFGRLLDRVHQPQR